MARAGTATRTRRSGRDVLGIYLNDHLAGATLGLELARRAAAAQPRAGAGQVLRGFAREVAEDRSALLSMMAALGVKVSGYKVGAAWIGEKAGRLKLNGHLLTRSPLSDLEELELLLVGVEGKAAGWRTLRMLADADHRLSRARLDELLARAKGQANLLEELRLRAAGNVVTADRQGHG